MKRALLALGLVFCVMSGAVPVPHSLAAGALRSHLNNQPPQSSVTPPGGWAMSKPYVAVYTTMVTPHNNVTGTQVTQFALRLLGYPYTLVGNSPALGFSCIGFVSYVYQSLGIPLPDELNNAMAFAPSVPFSELRPGDILWFQNTVWPGLSHTAIYLGGGRFIHSAWFGVGVITSSFQNDPRYGNYWTEHYLGASRPWGGAPPGVRVAPYLPRTVQPVPNSPAFLVTTPSVRLHRWWSLYAPVRTMVPRATPLIVLQRRALWYRVMTPDGFQGWIVSRRPVSTLADAVTRVASGGSHLRARHGRQRGRLRARVSRSTTRFRAVSARRLLALRLRQLHSQRSSARGVPVLRHARALRHIERRLPAKVGPHRHQRRHRQSARRKAKPWRRVLAMVRIRTAPTLHAHVLTLAIPGAHVRVLARHGRWKRIRLANGRRGFVYGKYVG